MLQTRMARLRERMIHTDTDLVVVGPSSHMIWLTGLSPHGDERPVMLIVSRDFAGFLMPALNADSSRQHTDLPFFVWSDNDGPHAALAQLMEAGGTKRHGISVALDETMRADFALLILDALPGAKRSFLGDTIGYLRARKDGLEYELLKASALINDGAMRAAFAALAPGATELEIADIVRNYYRNHGATPEFASVCFGENGAFPHHHSSERRLQGRDAVLIDIGGRSRGFPSDMTRVAFCGDATDEFRKVHAVLETAVNAAIDAAKPGVSAKVVDQAARSVISEAGYGEFFLHRTGHGIGIDTHEQPYITTTSDTVLDEGNVFSIEPGIYLSGRFGIRLEEVVIIRGGCAEILSELPRAIFSLAA